ncbi:MAG: homoserine kinase [Actinomycetota bacterium]|nr:homoserine kinase [Actinomycetota bacterium]
MRVRVPASSANLGPGFDTLAIALNLYTEVEVVLADRFTVETKGFGSEVAVDSDHLCAQIAREVLGHDNVAVKVSSEIPLSRGLGSSAALAVATAAACGAYDAFVVASELEGHCENAAASYFGGLVVGTKIDERYEARQLSIDPAIVAIVIVPEVRLATKELRAVLPTTIPFGDAVANLGRLALAIASFSDVSQLEVALSQDLLHERYREEVFPDARGLKELLIEAGAVYSCWSGAGSTVIGLFDRREARRALGVVQSGLTAFTFGATAQMLEVDHDGMVIFEDEADE